MYEMVERWETLTRCFVNLTPTLILQRNEIFLFWSFAESDPTQHDMIGRRWLPVLAIGSPCPAACDWLVE